MRATHSVRGPICRTARRLLTLCGAWTFLACLPAFLHAQNDGPPPPGTPMYTLHVYTNLVQIPTLVLNEDLRPLPLLTKDQFTLSIDDGPKFRPTQIHLQSEDPIVMAIVLDASGTEDDVVRRAAAAIATFAARALKPRDRVGLFAFDCTVAAAPRLLPPDPEKLRAATEELLKTANLHGPKNTRAGCYHEARSWSALAAVANAMIGFPGRRVLVAVTDAFDRNSRITAAELKQFAVEHSISIFDIDGGYRVPNPIETIDRRTANMDLQLLTSGTGGLMFQTTSKGFADTLEHIVALLRGRYIIEFPRPVNTATGSHVIDVKVPRRDAVIRTAGVSVPLPGDKELNDPDNVPSDPTRAPTAGTLKRKSR